MGIFDFFKRKNNPPVNHRKAKAPVAVIHPFTEQCLYLQEEFGLIIPQSSIDCLIRFNFPKDHYYYSLFWHFSNDFLEVFYNGKFIQLVVDRYQETYGKNTDLKKLQELLDDARFEFGLKNDCFYSDTIDFDFLNQCYAEYKASGEELMITLDFDYENLILTTELKGYVGQNYPSFNALYKTTAGIRYKILEDFELLEDIIQKLLDQSEKDKTFPLK
ncbi:hypothetical protein ACM46_17885 [Chryseobacterium angstadtii]|uniref:Uncharacterized protein n=1 Tax=Chryseobacterium angstadtii TaxID=558151 RepID=A0A0J7I128_9FLAO|nr:hypothetical protein [Chryseobacterium angstadtii]KMQ60113.1 hypothetical protein ACM46_17885 [Chryseobacterium angstadtii]